MKNGVLVWWSIPKQTGVVITENGERYFFHVVHVLSGPVRPKPGQKVTFVPSDQAVKPGLLPIATQVRIFDETATAGLKALKEAV